MKKEKQGFSFFSSLYVDCRQLKTLNKTGLSMAFQYDANGQRVKKTVNGTATTYWRDTDGKIVRMQKGSDVLLFLYEGDGRRAGFLLNGVGYYYVYNAQGDVVGLIDKTGAQVVSYVYDAWGRAVSVTGSSAATAGALNPFRYRGYEYDTESGLYYLNSRYYDPTTMRFVNADGVISDTGESVQGYNLFVYCFNNPVNMDDQSGHWPQWIKDAAKGVASVVTKAKAVLSFPLTVVKIAATSTVAVASGQATSGDVWNDIKNYNFFNEDETKVLNSKVFSSYKGTPVLKHDISGITSFSVSNTIILNKSETVNNGGIDTIKHEWGHTVQQSLIGTPKYITRIAAPSVIGCIINPSSKTYYSLPWERTADFFGGANRSTGYHSGSDVVAGLYLIMP